ncbi:hypothetical protein GF314_10935 [bacterium]|nr:hypothetical protein [bacterium]
MLDRGFLRRAQYGTLAGGVLVGAITAALATVGHGVGVAAGAAWAALNLRVLEGLIGVAVLPRDAPRDMVPIFLWGIAKLGVYGLAFWILIVRPFPAIGMVVGLTIMLVALVLAGLATRTTVSRDTTPRGDDGDG